MVEINLPATWQGETPVFLLIMRDEALLIIDLDERGWVETHKDIFERGEATWHLVQKETRAVCFTLVVLDSEKPYYVARHFQRASMAGAQQVHVAAYGIGKRRKDGHTDRLWVFYPSGQICTGDDVDILGRAALDQM